MTTAQPSTLTPPHPTNAVPARHTTTTPENNNTQITPTTHRQLHFRRIFSPLSETFIRNPLQTMAAQGHDVRVLSLIRAIPKPPNTPVASLLPARHLLNIADGLNRQVVKSVGLSDPDTLIWPALLPLLHLRAAQIKPDLIHAHFGPDGCLIAPVAKKRRVPLIVTFYGYDVSRIIHTDRQRWQRRYDKLFQTATALLAISKHIANKLIDLGANPDKVHVVPLGIDPTPFINATQAPHPNHTEPSNTKPNVRCLHIGRLTPKKDPITLIRAFDIARKNADHAVNLTLDIVGDGPLHPEALQAAQRTKAPQAITLHGAVPPHKIPQLMANAHIYTQHSVTAPDGDMEGLGVTFMEAGAAALPTVSTIHNGIPEVVLNNTTGYLVPERDHNAMAHHITQLALDPAARQRLGNAAQQRILNHFTIQHTIERNLHHHRLALANTNHATPQI